MAAVHPTRPGGAPWTACTARRRRRRRGLDTPRRPRRPDRRHHRRRGAARARLRRRRGGRALRDAARARRARGRRREATKEPEPVSSLPPLVGMGDTVRFETPEGAVVRVTASGYADPGDAPAGVIGGPRRAHRHPQAERDPRGRRGDRPRAPAVQEGGLVHPHRRGRHADGGASSATTSCSGRRSRRARPSRTTLAFSVGASSPIRFVCTPVEGSRPRSATWELSK